MTRCLPCIALSALLLLGTVPAAAQADSAERPESRSATTAAAPGASQPEALPKGKWPWFKRYRKAAETQPAALPKQAPAPAASAPPPETVEDLGEAGPAPAPGPDQAREGAVSQRRRMRTTRAPAAREAASPPPATPAPPASSRGSALGLPRELQRIDRVARRLLGLPASGGAAAVADLSRSVTVRRELEPLEARIADFAAGGLTSAEAHADYGAALIRHGLEEAGAAESLVALSLDPSLVAPWNNLSTVLRRAGHLAVAEDALDEAVRLDPRSAIARFNRALLYDVQGKKRSAELEYVAALEIDPSLWLPNRNPLVVGNRDAARALHDLYMKRSSRGGILLDTPAR